jgi:hypothetical protein
MRSGPLIHQDHEPSIRVDEDQEFDCLREDEESQTARETEESQYNIQ